ncbi:hypothetical protein H8959_015438 [Pygathrix nigripes]
MSEKSESSNNIEYCKSQRKCGIRKQAIRKVASKMEYEEVAESWEEADDSFLPPYPLHRILKRPTSNGVVNSPKSASRPALPVKSLAQREADYAETRKGILGSAGPEEKQEKPILDRPSSDLLPFRLTRISQPEDSRQPNNVIRQPLGPDGSQDFKQRR